MDVDTVISTHSPLESADTVNLIVALLVRFPEISSVSVRSADRAVRFSYVVKRRLDRRAQRDIARTLEEHIGAFLDLASERPSTVAVVCEPDEKMTFVHVLRDTTTLSQAELVMHGGLLAERFGDTLLKNPPPDEALDEDAFEREDLVDAAIDAMRDPSRQKSLVGFREEKRVHVYFLKSAKKAKATARS